MNVNKILSIIVPAYNMEAFLPKCLGSLIVDDKELLQKLDVIVVNDGSKDRTSMIAHEFEAKYPGVFHVIDKANGHYGSCINVGIENATGLYVKVLDADDWFDTSSLKVVVGVLSESILHNNVADLVLTDLDQVNEQGKVTDAIRYSFPTDRCFGIDVVLKNCPMLTMHGMIYRTALLHEMGYRQTEGMLYTDGEWISIPISRVRVIRFLPYSLYKYLVGRVGQSVAQYSKNVWMVEHLLKTVCRYYASAEMRDNADMKEYFRRFIRMTARKVYVIWLLKKPLYEANEGLVKFDDEFRRLAPECYDAIRFPILTFLRGGGIDFIARWRKRRRLTKLEYLFLRLYVWLHDRG